MLGKDKIPLMERATGQTNSGTSKTKQPGQAVTTTVPFTCPSTGAVLHTVKPPFVDVAAFVNLVMADYPDAGELVQPEAKAAMEAAISSKLLGYFASYFVKLTKQQFVDGGKIVIAEYKKIGIKSKPEAKELIKAYRQEKPAPEDEELSEEAAPE